MVGLGLYLRALRRSLKVRQAHSRAWRDGNAAHILTAVCSVTPQAEANGATTVLKAMYRKLITPVIDKTLEGRVRQRKHDGAVKCSRILNLVWQG